MFNFLADEPPAVDLRRGMGVFAGVLLPLGAAAALSPVAVVAVTSASWSFCSDSSEGAVSRRNECDPIVSNAQFDCNIPLHIAGEDGINKENLQNEPEGSALAVAEISFSSLNVVSVVWGTPVLGVSRWVAESPASAGMAGMAGDSSDMMRQGGDGGWSR